MPPKYYSLVNNHLRTDRTVYVRLYGSSLESDLLSFDLPKVFRDHGFEVDRAYRMGKVFFVELMHPRDVGSAVAQLRGQIIFCGHVADIDFYVQRKEKDKDRKPPTLAPTPPRQNAPAVIAQTGSAVSGAAAAAGGKVFQSPVVARTLSFLLSVLEQNRFDGNDLLDVDSALATLAASDHPDEAEASLDAVLEYMDAVPHARANGLQLVKRGSANRSHWGFRRCNVPDRVLDMAAFVEKLLRSGSTSSYNGACGRLLNGTGYTREELALFCGVLTSDLVLGNIRLLNDGREKNHWEFVIDTVDGANAKQTTAAAPVPARSSAAAAAPVPARSSAAAAAPVPVVPTAAAVVAAAAAAAASAPAPAAAAAAPVVASVSAGDPANMLAMSRWPAKLVSDTASLREAIAFFFDRSVVAVSARGTDLFDATRAAVRVVAVAAAEAKGDALTEAVAADDNNAARGRVFVFDVRASDAAVRSGIEVCLRSLLSGDSRSLVCHDARRTLPSVCALLGIAQLPDCFDTLVAFRALSAADVVPRAANMPYVTLQRAAQAVALPPPQLFEGVAETADFWSLPTLHDAQVEWAAESVRVLIPLRARLLRAVSRQVVHWSRQMAVSGGQLLAPLDAAAPRRAVGTVYRMFDLAPGNGQVALQLALDTDVLERPLPADQLAAMPADSTQRGEIEQQLEQFLKLLPEQVTNDLLDLVGHDTDFLIANLSQVTLLIEQAPLVRWHGTDTHAIALPTPTPRAAFAAALLQWQQGGWQVDAASLRLLPPASSPLLHRVSYAVDEIGNVASINAFLEMQRDNARLVPDLVANFLAKDDRQSVVFVGRSRTGQWSMLRGIAKQLALTRRVLAIDTRGGLSAFAKCGFTVLSLSPALGPAQLQSLLLSAVQNTDPQVVLVDQLDPLLFAAGLQSLRARRIPILACVQTPSLEHALADLLLKPIMMSFDAMVDVHAPFHVTVHEQLALTLAALTSPAAPAAVASERWRDVSGRQWLKYVQIGAGVLAARALELDSDFDWLCHVQRRR